MCLWFTLFFVWFSVRKGRGWLVFWCLYCVESLFSSIFWIYDGRFRMGSFVRIILDIVLGIMRFCTFL